MRKIIAGSRYDTDTAKPIGSHEHSMPGDFDWTHETLYKTKSGKFFLYGEGGPATAYGKQNEFGNYQSGERIVPFCKEDARRWAEKYLSVNEYEAAFLVSGEPSQVTAYLPPELVSFMDERKERTGDSRSDTIIKALRALAQEET